MTDAPHPWVPGQVVRISRDIAGAVDMTGFFVAASDEWVVLEEEYEFFVLGFAAVRREDVDLVVVDDFTARALEAVGEAPSDPGPLDLRTTETLVASIAQHHPLLVLNTEYDDSSVCWVGQVRGCESGQLQLREISPQGEWDDEDSVWGLDEVSKFQFGSRYAQALWTLGGRPPRGDAAHDQ